MKYVALTVIAWPGLFGGTYTAVAVDALDDAARVKLDETVAKLPINVYACACRGRMELNEWRLDTCTECGRALATSRLKRGPSLEVRDGAPELKCLWIDSDETHVLRLSSVVAWLGAAQVKMRADARFRGHFIVFAAFTKGTADALAKVDGVKRVEDVGGAYAVNRGLDRGEGQVSREAVEKAFADAKVKVDDFGWVVNRCQDVGLVVRRKDD